MSRLTFAACAAILALAAVGSGQARAQNTYPYLPPPYGPGYQTMLSPYLNLLRGGDQASNYFLGVLPEQQRRENRNQFRAQIGNLQIVTAPLRNPLEEPLEEVPRRFQASGHATAFGYTGSFFGGPAGGVPLGGTRGTQPRAGGGQAPRTYQPLGPPAKAGQR
jgi:hypothetical protein